MDGFFGFPDHDIPGDGYPSGNGSTNGTNCRIPVWLPEPSPSSLRIWENLVKGILKKNSLTSVLMDDTFDKLRANLLTMALVLGKPEGSWPLIIGGIMDARSVPDLLQAMLWFWSQCTDDVLRNPWEGENQKKWLLFVALLLEEIQFLDMPVNEALQKALIVIRKLGHRVLLREGEGMSRHPEYKSLKSCEKAIEACCKSDDLNVQRLAKEYTFSGMPKDYMSLDEEEGANEAKDLENFLTPENAGAVAGWCGMAAATSFTTMTIYSAIKLWMEQQAGQGGSKAASSEFDQHGKAGLSFATLPIATTAVPMLSGLAVVSGVAASAPIATFLALYASYEVIPVISFAGGVGVSMTAVKWRKENGGAEEDANKKAEELYDVYRGEWVSCYAAARIHLAGIVQTVGSCKAGHNRGREDIYGSTAPYEEKSPPSPTSELSNDPCDDDIHEYVAGLPSEPAGRRLLLWNNMGVGEDADVLEIMVWPWPGLEKDEVRFEFTGMSHIKWDKRLDVIPSSGIREELFLKEDQRHSTSCLYSLTKDWPLQLQVYKCVFAGFFKSLGPEWQVPPYPAIGGCLVRVIWVAVRPNNY